MRRERKLLTVAGVIVLIGLYACIYRDWFRPPKIQIYDRISTGRPMRKTTRTNQIADLTVAFGLDRLYELTEVKVVAVAELATNKYAHAVWHLVSDSNSIPVKGFNYGQHIRGMRLEAKTARPAALESNVTYRLFVKANGQKGQYDFKIGGKSDPGQ